MAASNNPDPNWTLDLLNQQDIDDLTEIARTRACNLVKIFASQQEITQTIRDGAETNRIYGFHESVTGAVIPEP